MLKPIAWLVALIVFCLPLLTACDIPQVSAEDRLFLNLSVNFLDAYTLPKQDFQGTPVGGLSALTYDRQRNLFYTVSDDRSEFAPARFYTFALSLDTATATPKMKDVELTAVTRLTNEAGEFYPAGEIDPEGIALSPLGTLFISSEGVARKNIPPFVREYDLKTGAWKRSLPIPQRYAPQRNEANQLVQGVGDNLGFEALTLNMTGGSTVAIEPFRLFTATESALTQDASPEHPQQGASHNRLLHYSVDPSHALLVSEHLYPMDTPPEGALYHGLVELLAIDQGGHFLSLERSFGANGFTVKLFQLALGGATDISNRDRLPDNLNGIQPIRKKLLLDLTDLSLPLDNLEGMTFGPRLPNGDPSLLLLSDNNFNQQQITQLLLFQLQGL